MGHLCIDIGSDKTDRARDSSLFIYINLKHLEKYIYYYLGLSSSITQLSKVITSYCINEDIMDLLLSPVQQKRFKDRIEQSITLKKLYQGIDSIPALTGAGVRFIDSEFNIVELRPFERIYLRGPVYIVLREPPTVFNADQFTSYLRKNQENPRKNKLVKEVAGAVFSCGAAALGWIVVFSSAAAIPVSGGASSAITYLSLGAALASKAQYPKRYTSSGIRNTYALQVKDAVGASLSFAGSALSRTIGNTAAGIWEEIDE